MRSQMLVDWDLAAATGARLAPSGPAVGFQEAEKVVTELRRAAVAAEEHVRAFTQLAGEIDTTAIVVVDRPDWIRGNVAGFRTVVEPLAEKLFADRSPPSRAISLAGSRLTGLQLGTLLAYLATRVLGQYEIFLPNGAQTGRLSLVAPNIVAAERRMQVDPRDFRLWVALHEVTHRAQFTAVPWLREHVLALLTRFVDASELDASALIRRLRDALGAAAEAARGRPTPSPIEIMVSPQQREIMSEITGLMSLVEGHAEYVMDQVGARVIPSVETLRNRFDARRGSGNPLERLVRRLIGMDLKMLQYAEGAQFVRTVVERVGMSGFNAVWGAPSALPGAAEIRDPAAWLRRMGEVSADPDTS